MILSDLILTTILFKWQYLSEEPRKQEKISEDLIML
jgi:hypothetical protein